MCLLAVVDEGKAILCREYSIVYGTVLVELELLPLSCHITCTIQVELQHNFLVDEAIVSILLIKYAAEGVGTLALEGNYFEPVTALLVLKVRDVVVQCERLEQLDQVRPRGDLSKLRQLVDAKRKKSDEGNNAAK